jgi:hypothetical protein
MKNKIKAKSSYYREKLREHILENHEVFFSKENEADSYCDFNRFPTKNTDRLHLCMPNEPMLIDRNYKGVHTYCVCTISERGKITSEYPVVEVNEIPYGKWRNGYFLLPELYKNDF